MRFLVFMIPEVYQPKNGKKTDPHFTPDAEMMALSGLPAIQRRSDSGGLDRRVLKS